MLTISAVMLVYNEIDFLPFSVDAVRPLVDEMIFIDMGSQDGGLDFLRSHKKSEDKIISYPRIDLLRYGFAHARNYGAAYATKDWIFMIDADEIVSNQDIRTIISGADKNCLQVNRHNYEKSDFLELPFCEKIINEAKFTKEYQRRIYKNDPVLEYKGFLHEEIYENNTNSFFSCCVADLTLHHLFAYRPGGQPAQKQYLYAYMLMHVHHHPGFRRGMNSWFCEHYIPENIVALEAMARVFQETNDLPKIEL